jgi:hypothetical protein
MLQKGVDERHALSEFSEDFGTGFYPDREENTSTESIIFKCASVVVPQSKDRSAETEVYPVALYQRPS